jgi:hypothetical protein
VRAPSQLSNLLTGAVWSMGIVSWSGCALRPAELPHASLATSLQELVPHGDRDHFVYIWQRTANRKPIDDGIQVEHVSARGKDEFEIVLSENGVGTGRVRIRADDRALLILGEDDLSRGIRLTYDPPLPYLEMPLVAGEHRATASAAVTDLTDGQALGTLQVTEVIQTQAAPPLLTPLGRCEHPVLVRAVRTLQGLQGQMELYTVTILAPGLGEVRSEGIASGAPAVYRELACATVGGRRIGDCGNLNARLEELRHAGSPHMQ